MLVYANAQISVHFIIVLGAVSRRLREGVPLNDLYAGDLIIIASSMELQSPRLMQIQYEGEKPPS